MKYIHQTEGRQYRTGNTGDDVNICNPLSLVASLYKPHSASHYVTGVSLMLAYLTETYLGVATAKESVCCADVHTYIPNVD